MMTRPGSPPGPPWMRFMDRFAAPAQGERPPRAMKWWWIGFAVLWIVLVLVRPLPGPSNPPNSYESATRIAGLPLVASGESPRGVIAYGSYPVGVIAVGGLPVGIIAVGGMAAGVISMSGVSLGLLAIGGLSAGWWSFGGGAVGYYAVGGLAIGGYAHAGGGVAIGYYEASGGQKERLFG